MSDHPTQDDLRIIPWRAWCASKGFTVDTGRRLRERGEGPRIVRISDRRIGVTVRDDREWTLARIKDDAAS
jgi:hypothetical protein